MNYGPSLPHYWLPPILGLTDKKVTCSIFNPPLNNDQLVCLHSYLFEKGFLISEIYEVPPRRSSGGQASSESVVSSPRLIRLIVPLNSTMILFFFFFCPALYSPWFLLSDYSSAAHQLDSRSGAVGFFPSFFHVHQILASNVGHAGKLPRK